MKNAYIMVHGKPFLSLGGQTHNSSSYVLEQMGPSFESIRAIGGNTMATPLPWDAFEPEEGKFNRKFVTDLIDEARRQEVKLTLLWFATWKNGTMEYCPAWVKRDPQRFPRAIQKDGTVMLQLSAHSEANLQADKAAFCQLIRILREYDREEQTVIAVQIENEAGILGGSRRDFSPLGQAAYEGPVPAVLTDYCEAHPDCYMAKVYQKCGCRRNASWRDTFGYQGAEWVTACAIARYIDEIARAGKEIYPELFLYANAWLDGGARGTNLNQGGLDWPSGCSTIHNLDVYYAVVQYLDTIAPDNYQASPLRHREVTDAYAHPEAGFPLFVPESGASPLNAGQMFYAFGEKQAIGYHIFGVESVLEEDDVTLSPRGMMIRRNFEMLKNVEPLLFDYQRNGGLFAAVQEPGEDSVVIEEIAQGLKASVVFGQVAGDWPSMDFRHRADRARASHPNPTAVAGMTKEPGRVLIFRESDKIFYLVGHGARVRFAGYQEDGSISNIVTSTALFSENAELLSVQEGRFDENGAFRVRLVRSGDEVRHGIWCQADCGVIRVELV